MTLTSTLPPTPTLPLTSSAGYSCLWIAAREGRTNVVQLLLREHRGLLNLAAADGRTPLYALRVRVRG